MERDGVGDIRVERTAISFSFRIDPSRISVVSTPVSEGEGRGEKEMALAARARFSIVSTVFPQAVNALLGGFRPLLCVHRDPVPPRDISPPFSAFTSTLTSFSTTFSGTFYPPLLFTRTPFIYSPHSLHAVPPSPPHLLLLGGENRDTLVRLEATIYF